MVLRSMSHSLNGSLFRTPCRASGERRLALRGANANAVPIRVIHVRRGAGRRELPLTELARRRKVRTFTAPAVRGAEPCGGCGDAPPSVPGRGRHPHPPAGGGRVCTGTAHPPRPL